jgi:hypothetical protein
MRGNKTTRAFEYLSVQGWASELIRAIESQGVCRAQRGLLFELRFAYEVMLALPTAALEYEYSAGVEGSTVDFRIQYEGDEWLVELLDLQTTDTVRTLRDSTGQVYLRSEAIDEHESPHAELIHVGERIVEKVWDRDRQRYAKFPEAPGSAFHLLLVGVSNFEGIGEPDGWHCRELMFGSSSVPAEARAYRAIQGIWDPANSRHGARAARERLHLVAFVSERLGSEDDREICRTSFVLANPALSGSKEALQRFPFLAKPRNPLYGRDE